MSDIPLPMHEYINICISPEKKKKIKINILTLHTVQNHKRFYELDLSWPN